MEIVRPPRLQSGDRVRFVSPASTPSVDGVEAGTRTLEALGFKVEMGAHVFDQLGYMAGRDEDRLADFNDAIRDPGVRAIFATCGGKGAYRIAGSLDFSAMSHDPKLVVGFSEITILHMALLRHCRLTAVHGACWDAATFGVGAASSFQRAVLTDELIVIEQRDDEPTANITSAGKVRGRMIGGNQDSMSTASGWALPSFQGSILLIEAVNLRLGHIDRQLTMLENAGHFAGIVGIAVGQYTNCGGDPTDRVNQAGWNEIDVLRDRLRRYNVAILGGLPIGHGIDPRAVPIGPMAVMDANAGTLTVEPAVR